MFKIAAVISVLSYITLIAATIRYVVKKKKRIPENS